MDDWLVSSVLICGWRDLKSKGGILDIVSFFLVSIFSSLVIKMAREDLLLLLLFLLLGGDVLHRGYGSGRVIGYNGDCCCGGIAVAVVVMALEIYSSAVAQVVVVVAAVAVAVALAVAVAFEIVLEVVLRKMVALVVVQCGYMIVIVCRL